MPQLEGYDQSFALPQQPSEFATWLRTGKRQTRQISPELLDWIKRMEDQPLEKRFTGFTMMMEEHMKLPDNEKMILAIPACLLSFDELLSYIEMEDISRISETDLALTLINGATVRFER